MSSRINGAGCILLALVSLAPAARSEARTVFKLTGDDVVVFAGGANMLHLQQAGHLEAILAKAVSPRASIRAPS